MPSASRRRLLRLLTLATVLAIPGLVAPIATSTVAEAATPDVRDLGAAPSDWFPRDVDRQGRVLGLSVMYAGEWDIYYAVSILDPSRPGGVAMLDSGPYMYVEPVGYLGNGTVVGNGAGGGTDPRALMWRTPDSPAVPVPLPSSWPVPDIPGVLRYTALQTTTGGRVLLCGGVGFHDGECWVWDGTSATTVAELTAGLRRSASGLDDDGELLVDGGLWDGNRVAPLPALPGHAPATNVRLGGRSQIVGTSAALDGSGRQAVQWKRGEPEALPLPAGRPFVTLGQVDDRGDVTGSACTDAEATQCQAVLWRRGRLAQLPPGNWESVLLGERQDIVLFDAVTRHVFLYSRHTW